MTAAAKRFRSLVCLGLLAAVACSDSPTSSTVTPILALFTDTATGFATSDVLDASGDRLRFDRNGDVLIWTATGARFDGFPVEGNFVATGHSFEIQFGMQGGAQRAYFTEHGPGTLCDVSVAGGSLSIVATSLPVPH